ncbi:hypothetical protein [Aliikangiella coralliicola]|uniref:Uncharacterized protein n=1 Tax=Aliikangiella coralliicola TaxID=2592383 RepID=A0A545UGA3_9GAMM|nr:hypothetical protein [Aliikangiella coralliicola]TQV88487.1 hypothetical protein FLL46_08155 [Aliikangiella coralliicola]
MKLCSDCGFANPDKNNICWSCMQPLYPAESYPLPTSVPPSLLPATQPVRWRGSTLLAEGDWLRNQCILDSIAVYVKLTKQRYCVAAAFVQSTDGEGLLAMTSNNPTNHLKTQWTATATDNSQGGETAKANIVKYSSEYRKFIPGIVATAEDFRRDRRVKDCYKSASSCVGRGTTNELMPPPVDEEDESRYAKVYRASKKMLHAEMRILDMLWCGYLQPIESCIYIGVAFPCCADCRRAIDAFNDMHQGTMEVLVAGSHSGTTINWALPAFLEDANFERAGANRLEEATTTQFSSL